MLAVIFTVIVATAIAFFATQNTAPISIYINNHAWSGIPLYLVVLVSFLVGLLFAWLVSLLNLLSASLELRRKEKELEKTAKALQEHAKKIQELQLENTRLLAKQEERHAAALPHMQGKNVDLTK